VKEENWELSY